jgi:putative toxin-antitoxin system antitoxin component (TIGR02293 family)
MYPVNVAKVAATLGGPRVLGTQLNTVTELAAAVAHGLPRTVVAEIATQAAGNPEGRRKVAALVVSPATYKRSPQLSPAASERAERLARITALAQQALGSDDEARAWLGEAHPLLGNRPPIEVAATDLGARQVERILLNIEYALPV